MRYGRKQRRSQKKERPFARRLGVESAKEGLGKLAEWGGAGVGMLLGLASARYGLPVASSVAATGGAVVGGMVGSAGKALVVATIDHWRDRRQQRAASIDSAGKGAVSARRSGRGSRGNAPRVSHFWSGPIGGAGEIISGIGEVIQQLERAHEGLGSLLEPMRASHDRIMAALSGGRQDVVQQTHGRLTLARKRVEDSLGLLQGANEDLRGYLSSI
ncbi:hypothetical protein AB0J86_20940 [Micromonospora sp. NPDC049559]|uniref:hypothetical protein n=1 Tax=Micromonospora sp. NPDC049559 TaxID=3155923 RepID=UPI003438ACF6